MTPMQKVDVLRAACCVAGIDGQPKESELAVINKLAGEVGVGRASLEAMIDRGATDPNFYQEQFKILKSDPQQSMAALLEVAMADGHITENETLVLRGLAGRLEVPEAVFDQLITGANKMLDG
ncbi:MAG: TerB family tellurite resistance protein [Mariniblastus sp.]